MAVYQYTSGTTRELPAAVRHTHRAVVVLMVAALYGTGIRPGDRFFLPVVARLGPRAVARNPRTACARCAERHLLREVRRRAFAARICGILARPICLPPRRIIG